MALSSYVLPGQGLSRFPRGCAALFALTAACGQDGDDAAVLTDAAQGAAALDATPAGSLSDAVINSANVEAGVNPSNPAGPEAGGIVLGGSDAGPPKDAGGPIIITLPTRSVVCGGSECTTTNNRTCCEGWSRATGFDGAPRCVTKAQCETDHVAFGADSNRVVMSDCDEPSDCSGGQICCFVRYGMPVTADLFSTEIVGPGASRLCLELSACNAGMMSISGVLGIPVGVIACKSAADCEDGTSCMPEQANSATTGKTDSARSGVTMCR